MKTPEIVMMMLFSAFIGGLFIFVTLRDSCFNVSYSKAFPEQCQ